MQNGRGRPHPDASSIRGLRPDPASPCRFQKIALA
jgi:hypothetical protein